MHIDHRRHVKDIASANEAAKSVLESCGVDFCCKGEASLREACIHAEVDPTEIEQKAPRAPRPPDASVGRRREPRRPRRRGVSSGDS